MSGNNGKWCLHPVAYVIVLLALSLGIILGLVYNRDYTCEEVVVLKYIDDNCHLVSDPYQTMCDLAVGAEDGCQANFDISDYSSGSVPQPTFATFCNAISLPQSVYTVINNENVLITMTIVVNDQANVNITRTDQYPGTCVLLESVYHGLLCDGLTCPSAQLIWSNNVVLNETNCDSQVAQYWNNVMNIAGPVLHTTCYRVANDKQLQSCRTCDTFTKGYEVLLLITATLLFALLTFAPFIGMRLKRDYDLLSRVPDSSD